MDPGDETVTRWIAAVLVGEHDPAGSPAGAENAVARAIALLHRAGGDAEPLSGGAVVAGFDQPAVAVRAATRLHLEATGGRLWRIGIHVGEVLMTPDGDATRAAVERATALSRIARSGTTAVAAPSLAAIGSIRHATLEALPAAVTVDGAVYLIVPLPPALRRRQLVTALAGTLVLGGAVAAAWMVKRPGVRERGKQPVTLGVGPFRLFRQDAQHARIGAALRDGLNTELSELSGVKVYSREFVDFLMTREGLAEIEVATRLGIQKMLSGAILVIGDSVRVDAQIVDVGSGVLEASYTTVGREQDFLALETDVILGVIARLNLPLSPEDERRLSARRTIDPEAYRRLRDAEGVGGVPTPLPPPEKGDQGRPRLLPAPRTAYAQDASAAVVALLEDYRRATEAHDVPALGAMYLDFTPEQRAALERYFTSVRDLRVRIAEVDIAVVADEAVVSYTRVDDFIDVPTGRPQHVSLRVTRTVRRVGDRWRFAAVR